MYGILTQAVGFAGTALCVGCYQFKSSRMLILCQMTGNILFVIHYLMLREVAGSVTVLITVLSSLVLSFKGRSWAEWKGWKWLFCGLLVASDLMIWRQAFHPADLVALLSLLIFVWMTWSGSAAVIRVGKLVLQGPTWFLYSLLVHSYAGMVNEVIAIVSALLSVLRFGLHTPEEQTNT